ncbi:MAG: hypothetical protein AAF802_01220 [Planctomycetota bacterium]
MNQKPAERLYQLLPAVYQQEDQKQGYPLKALLGVIGKEVGVVEEDIANLYQNWFIETCDDWVVPYIGDLVGSELTEVVSRAEIANTIRYRRRKGTLALLESLARDRAYWPAKAVEYDRLVAQTQSVKHLEPARGRWVDLRATEALDRLGSPDESVAHNIDVRRINSSRTPGRFNLPSVGLFVWRIQTFSSTMHRPRKRGEADGRTLYTLHPLGLETPLHTRPDQPSSSGMPDFESELDQPGIPEPIRRRAFSVAPRDFYGLSKSLQIWEEVKRGSRRRRKLVPPEQIVVADLQHWNYPVPRGARTPIALDPTTGRMIVPPSFSNRLRVTFHYGFPSEIGGGEYPRLPSQTPCTTIYRVFSQAANQGHEYKNIQLALQAWNEGIATGAEPPRAVIELAENREHRPLRLAMPHGHELQIRAAQGVRPIIRRILWKTGSENEGGRLVLDGLVVRSGVFVGTRKRPGPDSLVPDPSDLVLRDCTLPPRSNEGHRKAGAVLSVKHASARVQIENSIVGRIRIEKEEARTAPCRLTIIDSIVDGGSGGWAIRGPRSEGNPPCRPAHATAVIERSTVLGRCRLHHVDIAQDSIFTGHFFAARTQEGCMRFCYVPPGSSTPPRYQCQPDLVQQQVDRVAPRSEAGAWAERERRRVVPRFNSIAYGAPDYCQLSDHTATEIRRGSSEESELGVYHNLYQPQKEASLQTRLEEYTPAEKDIQIIHAS